MTKSACALNAYLKNLQTFWKETLISKLKGTIKWFNEKKGFGFIVPDIAAADVFVHISACDNMQLKEGLKVAYEMGKDREGKTCAQNVRAA